MAPAKQVDLIVADGRLEVCDGAHSAFVMKKEVKGPALRFAIGRATGHFRTGPATTAGCSHRRIMADVEAESMVGGTIFHRK